MSSYATCIVLVLQSGGIAAMSVWGRPSMSLAVTIPEIAARRIRKRKRAPPSAAAAAEDPVEDQTENGVWTSID